MPPCSVQTFLRENTAEAYLSCLPPLGSTTEASISATYQGLTITARGTLEANTGQDERWSKERRKQSKPEYGAQIEEASNLERFSKTFGSASTNSCQVGNMADVPTEETDERDEFFLCGHLAVRQVGGS